jgi:hypothetical protein
VSSFVHTYAEIFSLSKISNSFFPVGLIVSSSIRINYAAAISRMARKKMGLQYLVTATAFPFYLEIRFWPTTVSIVKTNCHQV